MFHRVSDKALFLISYLNFADDKKIAAIIKIKDDAERLKNAIDHEIVVQEEQSVSKCIQMHDDDL